jgi:hypothetical protein
VGGDQKTPPNYQIILQKFHVKNILVPHFFNPKMHRVLRRFSARGVQKHCFNVEKVLQNIDKNAMPIFS